MTVNFQLTAFELPVLQTGVVQLIGLFFKNTYESLINLKVLLKVYRC